VRAAERKKNSRFLWSNQLCTGFFTPHTLAIFGRVEQLASAVKGRSLKFRGEKTWLPSSITSRCLLKKRKSSASWRNSALKGYLKFLRGLLLVSSMGPPAMLSAF